MNDKILVDVLTLEKEGLVGFTELGKQVRLKSPPELMTMHYCDRESVANALPQGKYIQIGKKAKESDLTVVACNVYTKRK